MLSVPRSKNSIAALTSPLAGTQSSSRYETGRFFAQPTKRPNDRQIHAPKNDRIRTCRIGFEKEKHTISLRRTKSQNRQGAAVAERVAQRMAANQPVAALQRLTERFLRALWYFVYITRVLLAVRRPPPSRYATVGHRSASSGGGGEIRTPGRLPYGGFQNCHRPLQARPSEYTGLQNKGLRTSGRIRRVQARPAQRTKNQGEKPRELEPPRHPPDLSVFPVESA